MSPFYKSCFFCSAAGHDRICASCLQKLMSAQKREEISVLFADGALTLFGFEDARARKLLFEIKRRGTRFAVSFLARCVASAIEETQHVFSAVTYVPRRRLQLAQDGVDQAKLLARAVARELQLPCVKAVSRHGFSRRQHGLSREERQKNVRGKFRPARRILPQSLLLVDDVITTTATVAEVSRVLREAGVKYIFVCAPLRGGGL